MKSAVKIRFSILIVVLFFASCTSTAVTLSEEQEETLSKKGVAFEEIQMAEIKADEPGRAVLQTARKMVLDEQAVLPGTCWTWVDDVFSRAGYGAQKHIAYRSQHWGPYVDIDEIKPGDWLYFVNHSYRNIGHSGIFVYWVDKEKKIGVTLSYTGRNKEVPGRYSKYLLKDVYFITRPGAEGQNL
jgi:hypothetical protein